MTQEEKTFKVHCAHCGKSFHVRFPLLQPDDAANPEKSEQIIHCLHCGEPVIIKIPVAYVEEQHLIMGIPSFPKEL